MFIFYDIFFLLFAVAYLPYVLIKRKCHPGFFTRFGFLPEEVAANLRGTGAIWVHAVSVGEVLAVRGMVRKLQARYPARPLVISTVTKTGNDLAKKHFPAARVIYAPVDFSLTVRAYLNTIDPALYVSAETEIWPNLFEALHRRGIPVVQVNGRISDKSFRHYRRFRFILKSVLSCVRVFCMQTDVDARRIIEIGALPERVCVTGNMKFDDESQANQPDDRQIFQDPCALVLVAGSTHPGEEEIILDAFQVLRKDFPGLGLILAPRHIERVGEIAAMITDRKLGFCRLSEILKTDVKAKEIILVDTIGHLSRLYRYASVVFIGKSLVGRGGQNIIEPAALGKPVITGPHMENFRGVMDMLTRREAVVVVNAAVQLREAASFLLSDPEKARAIGQSAQAVVQEQKGAVDRTIERIGSVLPE